MITKIKNAPKTESPATTKMPKMPERICNSRCKICNSSLISEIHQLKKAGNTYLQISDIAKKTLNFDISSSGICRHFKNYQRHKAIISAEIINKDLIEEATKQAIHTKKLVELIDDAFKQIKIRVEARTLSFGFDSLEKLMKLRYQVMQNQDTDESDILAIFKKATDKYGLNLNQGVLFEHKKKKSGS